MGIKNEDAPTAVVKEVDGQLVLDDPTAEGVIVAVDAHNRGVAKDNCRLVFDSQYDRVVHFKQRCEALGKTHEDTVIVLLNMDDPHGSVLGGILMPGHDWDAIRATGQTPFARGLATKDGMVDGLAILDQGAAEKLKNADTLQVVVMDFGVVEVFDA